MSVSALIHLGSSSVSGGLIDGKKLVFATEHECRFQEELDAETFLKVIGEALKQTLNDLLTAKLGSPDKFMVFLSSPFVAGQLNILRHEPSKPFKVTEKLISDLVAQELAKFKDDKQHQIIDNKIMSFRVNGYVVDAPHGQKVNNLEVAHYLSIGATTVLKQFREIIRSSAHHDKIEFHSAGFASFSIVRRLRPAEDSLLLLEIGGEISELTLVWRGIIRESFSYPIGHHALWRGMVLGGNSTPTEAKSALSLGIVKDKHLAKAREDWLAQFQNGLTKIIQNRFWSGEIIVISEADDFSAHFTEWLSTASLERVFFSNKKLVVSLLNREALMRIVATESKVKASLPLLVDTAFVLR